MLDTGSGEVLISARPPAFAAWVPAVRVPPSRPAANIQAGSWSPSARAANNAPAGMRMKVWIPSQTESTAGILSARNSMVSMTPAVPSIHGFSRTWSAAGN